MYSCAARPSPPKKRVGLVLEVSGAGSKISMDAAQESWGRNVGATVSVVIPAAGTRLRLSEGEDGLFPGILDEITMAQIVPKLPWRAFYSLAVVSRGWRQANQSRQVYEARLRSESTETLVVVNSVGSDDGNFAIALYSMKDRSSLRLPPIPQLKEGLPAFCQSIALDGKIYVLGGWKQPYTSAGSEQVFVFDLAGQRGWKQCAPMRKARMKFGCGAIGGKIYVFGGTSRSSPVCGSEVYDPQKDAWVSIKPMISMRFNHHVATSGRELFLYGGYFYKAGGRLVNPESGDDEECTYHCRHYVEAYDTAKDEWRVVQPFGKPKQMGEFMSKGKFHWMNELDIHVHNAVEKSWDHMHSFSCAGISPVDVHTFWPKSILAVNEELLVIAKYRDTKCHLFQSHGFGGKNKDIVLQRSLCLGLRPFANSPHMCPIQL